MRIGFKHLSQQCIIGFSTFSPIRFTRWSHLRRSIGSGGPRLMVVKVGASSCDISASKSNCCSREGCWVTEGSCSSCSPPTVSVELSSTCCGVSSSSLSITYQQFQCISIKCQITVWLKTSVCYLLSISKGQLEKQYRQGKIYSLDNKLNN